MEKGNHIALFSETLGYLYEAAIDSSQWQAFVQHIAHAMNAKSAMIRLVDPHRSEVSFSAFYNFDPWFDKQYAHHFVNVDPILQKLRELPKNQIVQSSDQIDYNALQKTEYYNDYLMPQENHFLAGGLITNSTNQQIFLGVQRTKTQQSFDQLDLNYLQQLIPHIQRSFGLYADMEKNKLKEFASNNALENLGVGLFTLDLNGRITYSNGQAEALLQESTHLFVSKGRLRASDAGEDAKIAATSAEASSTPEFSLQPFAKAIRLKASDNKCPELYLIVTSQENSHNALVGLFGDRFLLVFIGRLAEQRLINYQIIAHLFKLTPAESELAAAITQGISLNDYCEKVGVSKNTGRSQLKAVFHKTGVNSQAALVAKLTQGPWFKAKN